MQRRKLLCALLAAACTVSLLAGCGRTDTVAGTDNNSEDNSSASAEESDHPVISMNAPYRNMSAFSDLVHEKYPEINLEIIPYNGQNTSAYMKDMRLSGQMTDIYLHRFIRRGDMTMRKIS